jgi:N-acetyl-beta-hexosaminidase
LLIVLSLISYVICNMSSYVLYVVYVCLGHAYSWGMAEKFKDITTACPKYTDGLGHIDDVPLDPTLATTYAVVETLLSELTRIFPDEHLHIGGDEVKYGCWGESESINAWMAEHGYAVGDYYALEQMFFSRIHKIAGDGLKRKLVAWEEVFFNASGGSDGIEILALPLSLSLSLCQSPSLSLSLSLCYL